MLPKKFRLPAEEFREKGWSGTISCPPFAARFKNNNLTHNRFGIVVGIGVDKRAARRHAIKRQIRANLVKLPNRKHDFLITTRGPIREPFKENIAAALDCLLENFSAL